MIATGLILVNPAHGFLTGDAAEKFSDEPRTIFEMTGTSVKMESSIQFENMRPLFEAEMGPFH